MDAKKIKDHVLISDAIGRLISIEKKGNGQFMAKCPFHNDNNPSLSISDTRQSYLCYSCGENGDVFDFYMKYSELSFKGAIDTLAGIFNIDDINDNKKEYYYEVNKLVMNLYIKNTKEFLCDKFEVFLKERKLSRELAEKFSLGIASSGNQVSNYINSFDDNFKKKNWQLAALDMGLIKEGKNGYYDCYKDRIIFPIINKFGHIIGFSTRKCDDNSPGPKYLNSPESIAFSKKNILFGENLVLKNEESQSTVFLVEGFMDVIRLYGAGYTNVLGLMGITISDLNIKKLLPKFEAIYLALDNDDAGSEATLKISKNFLVHGCLPKTIDLTPYKDPDEFLKELTREDFDKRVNCAESKIKLRN